MIFKIILLWRFHWFHYFGINCCFLTLSLLCTCSKHCFYSIRRMYDVGLLTGWHCEFRTFTHLSITVANTVRFE